MKSGKTVRLVTAADRSYLKQLAVAVRSAQDSLEDDCRLATTVLSLGLLDSDRTKLLSSWETGRGSVTFIDVDENPLLNLPATVEHISSTATYARLLLPKLLHPDVSRVIYVDADTVTRSGLGELWRTDLKGHALAAAVDPGIRFLGNSSEGIVNWRKLGLDPEAPYFNAGVLVLDLRKIREQGMFDRAFNYLGEEGPNVRWADQEALNAVVAGRFAVLPETWNSTYHYYSEGIPRPPAKIRHFAGHVKPWSSRAYQEQRPAGVIGQEDFFACLDRTAWAGWRPPATD